MKGLTYASGLFGEAGGKFSSGMLSSWTRDEQMSILFQQLLPSDS
jgi:hypothetical protein